MTRHKHADLIHAWAEGEKIEALYKSDGTWVDVPVPCWSPDLTYRIKPEEPEWWENIPEHGVLCWVSDDNCKPNSSNYMRVIITKIEKSSYFAFKDKHNVKWSFATPLTNEEIKQFLR